MRVITRTAAVLALVVLLVGAAAAAPAVDTETTATTTQSALTDGDSISKFNASETELPTLQASYDSANVAIEIIDPATGEVIERWENSTDSSHAMFDQTGNDSGTYYFNTTFNESDFAAVPMDANEDKKVKIKLIGNTSADEPPTTNFTITLNNTKERAVIYAGDKITGDSAPAGSDITAEFDEDVGWWGAESIPGLDVYDTFTVDGESVGVNGSDTDVYVVYASDNASTAFADAQDRKSWGEYDDGDWVKSYQLTVEDTNYQVFLDETPDDEPDDTYGVTTSVGPSNTDAIKVDLGDDAEDETSVDVLSVANDGYGWLAAAGIYARSLGLSLGVLVLIGGTKRVRSPRREQEV